MLTNVKNFSYFKFFFFESISFSNDEYFLTLRYNEVNLRQGPSRSILQF